MVALLIVGALLAPPALPAADRVIVRRSDDLTHENRAVGDFRALVIGIDAYEDPKIPDLETAVNDARAVAEILRGQYGFKADLLLNGEATRAGIYRRLRDFATTAGPNTSLLIYYAGHGELDREYGDRDGWWVPADAEAGVEFTYLDNVQVQKAMRNTEARHVLLVSDSCYAGSLFGQSTRSLPPRITDRYYLSIFNDRSRWGLTSGNKTPVADTGSGGHSIFAYQLLKTLCMNDKPYLSTLELYGKIAPVVANNASQTPMCRPVKSTGDMGGEFVFIRSGGDPSKLSACRPFPLLADSGGAIVETVPPAPRPEKKEASLSITSDVAGSTVWINGQKMGGSAPLTYPSIGPGHYRVKVGKEGYEPYERRVEVEPGKSYAVTAHLEKIGETPTPVAPIPPPEPSARDRFTNSLGMEFVRIPSGRFTMGSPKDEPGRLDREKQHRVTLTRDYFMQTTEVTQGQWKAVMGSNPSRFKNCGDDCPVERVSWNDVQEFIEKLNRREGESYRLPTEAEWEYAARAGTTTPFAYGRCLSTDQANYDGNYPLTGCPKGKDRGKTIPVGSLNAPNAWGLHDMSGNVWEWVQDWYGEYPTDAVIDPTGPANGARRVNRGGSWLHDAGDCRSAYRGRSTPGIRNDGLGFRALAVR